MRRSYALLGAAIAALAFAGCGDTLLDSTKTEEEVQASLSKSLKEKVSSVNCPSDQKVEAGATFTCSVKLSNGKTATATLKIRNEDADLSLVKFSETSQQGQ
jgi:hypothetical protein